VEIIAAAAAEHAGSARFGVDGASGANALIDACRSTGPVIEVETTSLDEFCRMRGLRPDVVKIDVEGAELGVLKGARSVLARPETSAFIEFHPTIWDMRGVSADAIRAELAEQQLIPEPLDPSLDVWQTEGIAVRLHRA
jgi:hypothetical protein